jgi:hypothetical protein
MTPTKDSFKSLQKIAIQNIFICTNLKPLCLATRSPINVIKVGVMYVFMEQLSSQNLKDLQGMT